MTGTTQMLMVLLFFLMVVELIKNVGMAVAGKLWYLIFAVANIYVLHLIIRELKEDNDDKGA